MSHATRFFLVTAGSCCVLCSALDAATTVFFDPSQVATMVNSGVTSDTIRSNGYLFTYTRDKLFTGGGSVPIGRQVRVPWPEGVEAQAVTAGPNPGKAQITIQRVDGRVFDLTAFTAKLLANTYGAGGSIEITPLLNGQDGLADPVAFDVTGVYGQTFHYDTTPNYWGSTILLTGFDTYKISLYVDFAFIGLVLTGPDIPGDYDGDSDVDLLDLQAFELCASGPEIPAEIGCDLKDFDHDGDVDQEDFGIFQRCYNGPDNLVDLNCAN